MLQVALAQLPGTGALIAVLGAGNDLMVGLLERVVRTFADAPGASVALPLRSWWAVLAAYVAIGLAAALVAGVVRRGEPRSRLLAANFRYLPRRARLAIVTAGAALVAAGWAGAAAPPGPPDRLTVRFLDIGQGDATLIQHPDGTAVLFDGGPPEGGVVRLLRRAGVDRLALVVATHASRDHHGGLPAVLRRFEVETLLDGGDDTTDPSFRALEALADQRGIERIPARAPLTLTLADGDLRIEVLSPPPRPPGPASEDPNPRAVVAIVSSRGFDLLLSADAESETLLPLELRDVDAIKVPHHGSSDPGLPEVLERLRPELAGIEVGLHNTYGHPAPATLSALKRAEVPTYRTDLDGTVTVSVDGPSMRVETER
jgi:competence protein ComEC